MINTLMKIRDLIKLIETSTRAQTGGEIGVNGYEYKGGQFLPSTDAPPGTWRVKIKGKSRLIGSKAELVAPGQMESSPTPFSRSIYGIIRQIVNVNTDGTLSPIDNEAAINYYGRDIVPGVNGIQGTGTYDVEELVDLFNRGARWIDVTPPDVEIVAKG
jgi:hypothetical protein